VAEETRCAIILPSEIAPPAGTGKAKIAGKNS
jgi:hypothetical protein